MKLKENNKPFYAYGVVEIHYSGINNDGNYAKVDYAIGVLVGARFVLTSLSSNTCSNSIEAGNENDVDIFFSPVVNGLLISEAITYSVIGCHYIKQNAHNSYSYTILELKTPAGDEEGHFGLHFINDIEALLGKMQNLNECKILNTNDRILVYNIGVECFVIGRFSKDIELKDYVADETCSCSNIILPNYDWFLETINKNKKWKTSDDWLILKEKEIKSDPYMIILTGQSEYPLLENTIIPLLKSYEIQEATIYKINNIIIKPIEVRELMNMIETTIKKEKISKRGGIKLRKGSDVKRATTKKS